MRALIFSPRAASDIDEIYDFTAEAWGVVRAKSYIATLRQRCESLQSRISPRFPARKIPTKPPSAVATPNHESAAPRFFGEK